MKSCKRKKDEDAVSRAVSNYSKSARLKGGAHQNVCVLTRWPTAAAEAMATAAAPAPPPSTAAGAVMYVGLREACLRGFALPLIVRLALSCGSVVGVRVADYVRAEP